MKIGGTKNVKIERAKLSDPGYRKRKLMPEEYPFSMLEPAQKLSNGDIEGDSFFIPDSDKPQTHLARSRKQLSSQGAKFWTRKDIVQNADGEMVSGLRIWRANAAIDEAEAARPSKAKAEVKTTSAKAPAKNAAAKKTPVKKAPAKKTAAPAQRETKKAA